MKFDTETELIDVLRATLKGSYSRKGVSIFEEVSLGYGVADMVLSIIDEDLMQDNLEKEELTACDINIYNLIAKKAQIDLLQILNITRSSKTQIKGSLNKLINNGYIVLSDNSYSISKTYEFPFELTYAIEAKLKDWKRALKQAYRYKWFAEYSYVVLDECTSRSARNNIHLFKRYNIGLATINKVGELKRYYKPVIQKPFDVKMQMLLCEKIIRNSAVC